jgi:hypothetical protein
MVAPGFSAVPRRQVGAVAASALNVDDEVLIDPLPIGPGE